MSKWTNDETKTVATHWLTSNGLFKLACDTYAESGANAVAVTVESATKELVELVGSNYSMATDLANAALERVNWNEATMALIEEIKWYRHITSEANKDFRPRGSVLKKLDETPARSEKAEEPAGRKTKEMGR